MSESPLIAVENATFSYDRKRTIFHDINFTVDKAQVFCIMGPNGCGKTTLIDCILGLLELQKGEIRASGHPIKELSSRQMAEQISYVPQGHRGTFAYTVLDIVTMGCTHATGLLGSPGEEEYARAHEALAQVGLQGFKDRIYTELSGGELQLVLIARAIAQDAKVMVLDEPTAHLDFSRELDIIEAIVHLVCEQRTSVIMATHFLNQAYVLESEGIDTRVGLLHEKHFKHVGLPSRVLTAENLEHTFGIVSEIVSDSRGRNYILPLHRKRNDATQATDQVLFPQGVTK
jgi:iron complex transport system ATP-binding protein